MSKKKPLKKSKSTKDVTRRAKNIASTPSSKYLQSKEQGKSIPSKPIAPIKPIQIAAPKAPIAVAPAPSSITKPEQSDLKDKPKENVNQKSLNKDALKPKEETKTKETTKIAPIQAKGQNNLETFDEKKELKSTTTQSVGEEFPKANVLEIKKEIESLLFSSGKAMGEETIAGLTKRDISQVKEALKLLQKEYDAKDSALAIFQEGTTWKLTVRERYQRLVRKIVSDIELSKSILKTLATIAWKSPVLQSEIIRMRSNKGYDHIDELEEMGFIAKEKKGRSFQVRTTQKFADYFEVDGAGSIKKAFQNVSVPEQKTLTEMGEQPVQKAPEDELPKTIKGERIIDQGFLEDIDKKISAVSKKREDEEKEDTFKNNPGQ